MKLLVFFMSFFNSTTGSGESLDISETRKYIYSCLGQKVYLKTLNSNVTFCKEKTPLQDISVPLSDHWITRFCLKPPEKEKHSAQNVSDRRSCFISLLEKGLLGKYIVRYPCNSHFNINKGSVQVHFLSQYCQLGNDTPTHSFCSLLFCSAFTYAICDVCIS